MNSKTRIEVRDASELVKCLAMHSEGKKELSVFLDTNLFNDKGVGLVSEAVYKPNKSSTEYFLRIYSDELVEGDEVNNFNIEVIKCLNTFDTKAVLGERVLTIFPRSYYDKEALIDASYNPEGIFDRGEFERQLSNL